MMYGVGTFGSYIDPIPRARLFGHNTLIEANLPYTLHLPAHRVFRVTCPHVDAPVTVQIRKVWTELATGSIDVEAYADDQPLYYGSSKAHHTDNSHKPQRSAHGRTSHGHKCGDLQGYSWGIPV